MRTILVAIDFSKNAEHALEYAIMYAEKLSASIYLMWVDDNVTDETVLGTISGELRIEKRAYLKNLNIEYKDRISGGKFEVILRKGRVYQEIAKAASKINADMIFAGTHGVSGYEQHWIGSNAYRVVTQAPCPVFTIRSSYQFGGSISKILLPLDSSLETKQKLPFVADLALKFSATVYLLKVYNTTISVIRKRIDKFGDEAVSCLTERGVDFIIEKIEANNVAVSIIEYSNKNDIDLIAIMTDQGVTTANKFLGPYSQQLINNSTIPVVSVRAKVH
ncbi:MAG: universal stress protein [Bacteroidales bacterium]|nr:universal stress protein [Bacteroidales bacterium]